MTTQQYPILYSFRRCPYAMRARMALKKASMTCELREVILRDKPEEMIAISSKGTVPVLQLQDGNIIDESIDVMLWALKQSDPDGWLETDMAQVDELINCNDFEFKQYLDRYKYFQDYPEHPQTYYRELGEKFFQELETRLAKFDGLGLLEERTTFADVALFPFIRQFARVDWDWFNDSRYTLLINWLKRFEHGQLFISIMQKYKQWETGDQITLFH